MVYMLPQAPGTMPYQTPLLAQILQGMGPMGQALGAPDQNGNQGGVAAVLQAMQQRKPLQQFMGMPPTPQGQPSPLGPAGQVPVNKLRQVSDIAGKGGVGGILNQQSGMTLYMTPDGQLSMQPSPGAIPIGGYKGPAAADAVRKSKHEKFMEEHAAVMEKLKSANTDNLSAEDKKMVALARINAQALSNPIADFSDEDMATMRDTIKNVNRILSKSAGMDGSSSTPSRPAGGKKRVKVRGPKGERGTVEEGDKLPQGWKVVNE
jgi:hypothetical protein